MRLATWNLERPQRGNVRRLPGLRARIDAIASDVWVLTETDHEAVGVSASHPHRVSTDPVPGLHTPGARWTTIWSRLPRAGRWRDSGVLDPFAVVPADGASEDALRGHLAALSIKQLKDIVAEHAMDTTKRTMKWETPDRLINLIVATVRSRLAKSSAFRQS